MFHDALFARNRLVGAFKLAIGVLFDVLGSTEESLNFQLCFLVVRGIYLGYRSQHILARRISGQHVTLDTVLFFLDNFLSQRCIGGFSMRPAPSTQRVDHHRALVVGEHMVRCESVLSSKICLVVLVQERLLNYIIVTLAHVFS